MEDEKREERISKRNRKLLLWNVTGIGRQDLEFLDFIESHDFVGLCKIWIDNKGWNEVKDRLPTSHEWICKYAEKKNVKGRACGSIIVGLRKLWGKGNWELIESKYEGILHLRIKDLKNRNALGKNDAINILTVYNSRYRDEIGEVITKILEVWKRERMIVGGDFNLRIGELGGDGEE